jgi:hypothetical protein
VTIQLTATTLVPTDPSTPISRSVPVPGVGCEKGYGPGANGITCEPCPKGQYSPSGLCLNCTTGFTTTGTGSENCTGEWRACTRMLLNSCGRHAPTVLGEGQLHKGCPIIVSGACGCKAHYL